ncbi:MAG TPA: glycosyl hydrolase [Polyangiales bacterium]|nr:glycosyl hydrolase [Polyangiales bacterium]
MLRKSTVASWTWVAAFVASCSSDAAKPPAANGGDQAVAAASGSGGDNAAGSTAAAAAGTSAGRGAAQAGTTSPGTAGQLAAGRSGATSAGTEAAAGSSGVAAGSGGAGTAPAGMKPYKGVANSPCAARKLLGVSWYYNWMQSENEPCTDGLGGEFVPMIWGHTGAERQASAIQASVTKFAGSKYGAVLGFNEPDNPSQSDIPVAEAIQLWPSFDNTALRIGTPGTAANANPGQAWFKDFMTQLNATPSLRADFLAIHWYGWNAGSCDAKASQLENYLKWAEAFPGDRPIWITEWGCLNQSAPDEATVIAFYKAAVAMFAKHPRVERYAWYPWSTNCNLNAKDGSLTKLGEAYAEAPAMR